MNNLRQAAQQALEVLENDAMQRTFAGGVRITNAAIALRAALAEPERKPLTDEEVVALFNRLCQERSAWPERRYRDFARWVERAHGITGESK